MPIYPSLCNRNIIRPRSGLQRELAVGAARGLIEEQTVPEERGTGPAGQVGVPGYDAEDNPIWEYQVGLGRDVFNLYFNGRNVAANTTSGLFWRHLDHLGSLNYRTLQELAGGGFDVVNGSQSVATPF